MPKPDRPALKDDILYGAEEIRAYLRLRDARQVFRLRQKGHAPIFNTPGVGLTARKSGLDEYFAKLEAEDLARRG
ncbi:hypothetical protein [Dongia sp.]|uniref:hypothetical protein n=1 Tax=Dongia sp. TaxID=1977262 RepID=UPI0037511BB5